MAVILFHGVMIKNSDVPNVITQVITDDLHNSGILKKLTGQSGKLIML